MQTKRAFYWLLVVGTFALTTFILVQPANAHPNKRHQAHHLSVRKGGSIRRIDPPRAALAQWAEDGTVERGSQTCKSWQKFAYVRSAWPYHEMYRWTQRAKFCYDGTNLTYTDFDAWSSTAWWTIWDYRGIIEEIGPQSVDPQRYMYYRTGAVWKWTLPWPLPLSITNVLKCAQTVRGNGTVDGGCWEA